ncbi:MAG TPA: kelch repeat-containing protein [Candidatus Sulfotelmatobacter sp.]|jgi:N-acetylneuraminic acid mutarotase|nr:kelch repeat-containing protein [Candidatus Sulfotelmatobacter sp.]
MPTANIAARLGSEIPISGLHLEAAKRHQLLWVNISAMKKIPAFFLLVLWTVSVMGQDEPRFPPMPAAVSSNAVASLKGGFQIFSLMGVGPKKNWDDVTNQVYMMTMSRSGRWTTGRSVPGPVGRLNAAAAGAKGLVVLMGGYVVDNQGMEVTVPDVNVYEPGARRWSRGKDIPVPVDSAVTGVIHDRLVYLIGGRSAGTPVNNVQIYDVERDTWTQATPFPGTPAFGMAGGVADEEIVVVDGAKPGPASGPRYVRSDECWLGKIDKKDPAKIEWSKLPPHPGPARFGIAGGGAERDHRIYFSGGTATPHDYKGTPYDGQPVEVSTFTFDYELHGHKWETLSANTYDPRVDGRGLIETPLGPVVLGGMAKNLAVTARVTLFPKK